MRRHPSGGISETTSAKTWKTMLSCWRKNQRRKKRERKNLIERNRSKGKRKRKDKIAWLKSKNKDNGTMSIIKIIFSPVNVKMGGTKDNELYY